MRYDYALHFLKWHSEDVLTSAVGRSNRAPVSPTELEPVFWIVSKWDKEAGTSTPLSSGAGERLSIRSCASEEVIPKASIWWPPRCLRWLASEYSTAHSPFIPASTHGRFRAQMVGIQLAWASCPLGWSYFWVALFYNLVCNLIVFNYHGYAPILK